MATSAGDAPWIAYPGDYAIWQGNRVQARRVERGAYLSPFWPQYSHHSRVWFKRHFTLSRPETVRFDCDGNAQVCCALTGQVMSAVTNVFTVPAGTNVFVRIGVENSRHPPMIRIDGPTVRTDSSWLVEWHPDEDAPAEELRQFAKANEKPSDWRMRRRLESPVCQKSICGDHLFADFVRETYGYLRFRNVSADGLVRVIYGESEDEALDEDITHCDSWELLRLTAGDEFVAENPHGFRYVHVIPVDPDVSVGSLAMDYEWNDLPRKGSFRCSDDELNRIWDVADRTLELTCREVFIEGVKRDHWVWSGDAVQSCLMAYYRNGDFEGAKRTLWCIRGKDPLKMHLNGIIDYSFYWLIAIRDFDLYAGDAAFLRQVYPRMKSLLDFVSGRLDENGRPAWRPGATPYGDDWVFIDWAKEDLHGKEGVCSFEMVLYARALESAAYVAERVGAKDEAAAYLSQSRRVRDDVMRTFWNDEKGALMHLLKFDGSLSGQLTSYPNLFALAYGYFDADRAQRVFEGVILNESITSFQTPYMRFYEMDLLCGKGRHGQVLDSIKSYWGGMLKEGATSFWEAYNPDEKGAEHFAMYGRPFARSLCHAWGASPVYLFGKHFLGVRPTSSGYSSYAVEPHLGSLEWMEGTVPTPRGIVKVSVRKDHVEVVGSPDGTGTLVWNGQTRRINPNARIALNGEWQ
ncbi:MAG: alpha-rhamnosidase [Kiritimatiellae bacterium]|nr:alpha-rhamnosidase [Kiritimatiellia bacterium]